MEKRFYVEGKVLICLTDHFTSYKKDLVQECAVLTELGVMNGVKHTHTVYFPSVDLLGKGG